MDGAAIDTFLRGQQDFAILRHSMKPRSLAGVHCHFGDYRHDLPQANEETNGQPNS
jgi:hypothetical protein